MKRKLLPQMSPRATKAVVALFITYPVSHAVRTALGHGAVRSPAYGAERRIPRSRRGGRPSGGTESSRLICHTTRLVVVIGTIADAIVPAALHHMLTGHLRALLTSDDDPGRASSERRSFIRYGMRARLDRNRAGAGYVCRAAWSLRAALDDLGTANQGRWLARCGRSGVARPMTTSGLPSVRVVLEPLAVYSKRG
jgi:hypothetical protein